MIKKAINGEFKVQRRIRAKPIL